MSETSSISVPVRCVASPLAVGLGWKSSFSAAACTRARVEGATRSFPFITRETVPMETPASAATS